MTLKKLNDCRDKLSIKWSQRSEFYLSRSICLDSGGGRAGARPDIKARVGISWGMGSAFVPVSLLAAKLFRMPPSVKGNTL